MIINFLAHFLSFLRLNGSKQGLLNLLLIAAMTAMLFALQILPLALNTGIGLHLRHCLSPFKTITVILLYQIGKNKRVGSFLAIFRKNTNQEQVYRIRLVPLQNLQHLQPTRREKPAIAYLAQRIGKRREGNTKGNQFVASVAIYHTRYQVQVCLLDISIYIFIYLLLRKLLEIIEILISLVHDFEHLPAHSSRSQFAAGELMNMQIISALYHLGSLGKLSRRHFRNPDAVLQPVVILLIERKTLQMRLVIRIIVIDIHRRLPVEALDEQAFTVHIRKSERTYAFVHSLALAPVFYRAQQGTGNRYIIHEIEPAEANLLLVSLFVGTMVDNASNSTYDTSLAVNRQEVLSLAEFEGRILLWVQRIHLVETQKRNGKLMASVEIIMKLNEGFQPFFSRYRYDSYLIIH